MVKVLKIFASIVIGLFTLSIFGWMSVHLSREDKDFGFLNQPVKSMYSFPDLFTKSVEEAKALGLPKTFIKTPEDFQPVNKLEEDVIALFAYSDTNNSRTVAIINLKNDSTVFKWTFDQPIRDYERVWNPLLLPDKNLVYSYKGETLKRIDSLSNVIWKQDDFWPNHSINIDSQGNIWACAYETVYHATGYYKLDGEKTYFKDEYIAKVDGATGELLFKKSMAELLKENNLSNHLLKSGNLGDPIHINDIQPALKTTPYYKEGDIFISAKNLSAILHYRPATNELIDFIEGPFSCQHDVDFYNDSSLVFFNNNYYSALVNKKAAPKDTSYQPFFAGDFYSQVVRYNFKDQSFSVIGDSIFKANEIFTRSEGLVDFYDENTYFVEEQNSGVLWIIKDDEVIYKNVMESFHEGFHHLPNWTRIIENYE